MQKYYDEHGVSELLTKLELFKFLVIRGYIPDGEKYEDWVDKLDDLVIKVDGSI